jgi:hypothetical protein
VFAAAHDNTPRRTASSFYKTDIGGWIFVRLVKVDR